MFQRSLGASTFLVSPVASAIWSNTLAAHAFAPEAISRSVWSILQGPRRIVAGVSTYPPLWSAKSRARIMANLATPSRLLALAPYPASTHGTCTWSWSPRPPRRDSRRGCAPTSSCRVEQGVQCAERVRRRHRVVDRERRFEDRLDHIGLAVGENGAIPGAAQPRGERAQHAARRVAIARLSGEHPADGQIAQHAGPHYSLRFVAAALVAGQQLPRSAKETSCRATARTLRSRRVPRVSSIKLGCPAAERHSRMQA